MYLLLQGCMIENKLGTSLNGTIGKTTTYLRINLGPPTDTINNAEAGVIWEYAKVIEVSSPGTVIPVGGAIYYTNPNSYTEERSLKFWIKDNKIYKWQSNGYATKKKNPLIVPIVIVGSIIGKILFVNFLLSISPTD